MNRITAKVLSLLASAVLFFLVLRLAMSISSWLITGYIKGLGGIASSMSEGLTLNQVSIPSSAVALLLSCGVSKLLLDYIDSIDEERLGLVSAGLIVATLVIGVALGVAFKY